MATKTLIPRILCIAERSYCASFQDWFTRCLELQELLVSFPTLGLQIRNKTTDADSELEKLLPEITPSPQIWLNGIIETTKVFQRHISEYQIKQSRQYPVFASSIHSPEALDKAISFAPKFLQYGAVFATSKPVQPLGISRLQRICDLSSVPILAVGGIDSKEKIIECTKAGADGVSIGSWIMQAKNMKERIEDIL